MQKRFAKPDFKVGKQLVEVYLLLNFFLIYKEEYDPYNVIARSWGPKVNTNPVLGGLAYSVSGTCAYLWKGAGSGHSSHTLVLSIIPSLNKRGRVGYE